MQLSIKRAILIFYSGNTKTVTCSVVSLKLVTGKHDMRTTLHLYKKKKKKKAKDEELLVKPTIPAFFCRPHPNCLDSGYTALRQK